MTGKVFLKNKTLFSLFAFGLILITSFSGAIVKAHEIRPTVFEFDVTKKNTLLLKALVNFEALIAGRSTQSGQALEHSEQDPRYGELRSLSRQELELEIRKFFPSWIRGITIKFDDASIPLTLGKITIRSPEDMELPRLTEITLKSDNVGTPRSLYWRYNPNFGDSIVRLKWDGDKIKAFWLKPGDIISNYDLFNQKSRPKIELFIEYIKIGFIHILPLGLDHILFILGLYFLSLRLKFLLVQITSFTVAHSITLGLATVWNQFQIASSIIEPLIALSIVFIAVENLFTDRLSKWRPIVIFIFGLIHGIGFSGVLKDVGYQGGSQLLALGGFSVGVELGQISVVLIAFLSLGVWFGRRLWYRAYIVRPGSVLIGVFGAFWFVERIW